MFKCENCQVNAVDGELKVTKMRQVTYISPQKTSIGSEIVEEKRFCPTCAEEVNVENVAAVTRNIRGIEEKKHERGRFER